MRLPKILILVLVSLFAVAGASAQRPKDKLLNRPYADNRTWHLGFSVGMFIQDLHFTHNGYITEDGEQWRVEQPGYSPGFCVNGLFSYRLNKYLSFRATPGMYFGNRDVHMLDLTTGATERQNIKSAYVVVPLDIKYHALRNGNMRPYISAGVMPAFDVSKRRSDFFKLKSSDVYLSVGMGCEIYLPFFKLSPELKFCVGLSDQIVRNRPDLADDPGKLKFTQSVKKATSKMFVLTFYFE